MVIFTRAWDNETEADSRMEAYHKAEHKKEFKTLSFMIEDDPMTLTQIVERSDEGIEATIFMVASLIKSGYMKVDLVSD